MPRALGEISQEQFNDRLDGWIAERARAAQADHDSNYTVLTELIEDEIEGHLDLYEQWVLRAVWHITHPTTQDMSLPFEDRLVRRYVEAEEVLDLTV